MVLALSTWLVTGDSAGHCGQHFRIRDSAAIGTSVSVRLLNYLQRHALYSNH